MPDNTMNKTEIVDRYFQEHRAKLLDIAAFLDRVDRCGDGESDFRIEAMRSCIQELLCVLPHCGSCRSNTPTPRLLRLRRHRLGSEVHEIHMW